MLFIQLSIFTLTFLHLSSLLHIESIVIKIVKSTDNLCFNLRSTYPAITKEISLNLII